MPATGPGRALGIPPGWWPLLVGQLFAGWVAAEAQSLLQLTGRLERLALVPVAAAALTTLFLGLLHGLAPGAMVAALAALVVAPGAVWGVTWWREFRRAGGGAVRPDRAALLATARYGWPAVPAFLVGYASDWGDHLILQAWFSAREVGLFQSAYQTMTLSIGLAAPMTTLLLPRMIDLHAADPESTKKFVTRVFPTVATLWAFAILPLIAVLPALYSVLLGARFADGLPLLTLLLLAVPGAVVLQLYTVLFSVQGRLGRTALYVAVMAGLDLALTLILLPSMGPRAAAVGTAASYVVSQSLYVADQHRHLRLSAARILPVFAILVAVAAAQAVVGAAVGPRLGVTAAGLAVLVWVVRRERIVEDDVVTALSGPLGRAAAYSMRVLRAAGGH
jgi:PST family polysaccharide transporter